MKKTYYFKNRNIYVENRVYVSGNTYLTKGADVSDCSDVIDISRIKGNLIIEGNIFNIGSLVAFDDFNVEKEIKEEKTHIGDYYIKGDVFVYNLISKHSIKVFYKIGELLLRGLKIKDIIK